MLPCMTNQCLTIPTILTIPTMSFALEKKKKIETFILHSKQQHDFSFS